MIRHSSRVLHKINKFIVIMQYTARYIILQISP